MLSRSCTAILAAAHHPDDARSRILVNLQNTFGTSGPAVAMRVAGDRAAFYGCRFVSFQDTLLDNTGRHYYRGCYIEGGTDFVFGNARALFDVRICWVLN